MKRKVRIAGILMLVTSGAAQASETIKYTYDAQGRLVRVERTGTVNNGVNTDYEIDKADNRKRVKTTGAATSTPPN